MDDGDLDYDEFESMPDDSEFEELWAEGYHIDNTGKKWKLKNMTEQHLRNTIKYFPDANTGPLERELERRRKMAEKFFNKFKKYEARKQ